MIYTIDRLLCRCLDIISTPSHYVNEFLCIKYLLFLFILNFPQEKHSGFVFNSIIIIFDIKNDPSVQNQSHVAENIN